ncbi:MAG: hypothetical protein ABWY12_16925 [Burkholderiales bacterium]
MTRVTTMVGQQHLTNATGFFFERDGRLFLVTSRHVVLDEASDHRPDRLEIELHVAPENVAMTRQFSIPLYRDRKSIWREARDAAGAIDVVALELERSALPEQDEHLDLNCAWYADVLLTLTQDVAVGRIGASRRCPPARKGLREKASSSSQAQGSA